MRKGIFEKRNEIKMKILIICSKAFYNHIPEGMLYDEISGFLPVVIHGDLELVG